jgi:hypothetical protein
MMADFLSTLVGQVQGTAPAVVPLLLPRFAPWPGLPRTGAALFSRGLVSAQERGAQPPLLQSPLIDPGHPAIEAPLPTFRQMSELKPALEPFSQPGQEPVAQIPPETADFEPGVTGQAVLKPVHPAVETTLPGAPQTASPHDPLSPATSPAPPIQTQEDRHKDSAVTASPAFPEENGERLAQEPTMPETGRELPPPLSPEPKSTLQTSPRLVAGEDSSKSFTRPPGPPARRGELLQHPLAEPVEVQPELVEFQSKLIEGRPAPIARPFEPVKRQPNRVEQPPAPVTWQPASVKGHAEPIEGHTKPVEVQPELVEARRAEIPAPSLPYPPAPAPHTVQPAVPALREGMEPITPLVPPPAPDSGPDLPVSIQTRESATPVASTLTTGSVEPAPPVGRAVPGEREPVIVPVPEHTPGEMGSTTADEDAQFWRLPSERPNINQPEAIPTVRVTIGRVVVRASPAAERPPSQRIELPRPPLSLEEYLRGRQGGGR